MIVNHLSALLGARRMTVKTLRDRTGLAYGTLHDLYHDRSKRVDLATLDKVCSALGVGVGELLEHVPDA